MDIEVHEIKLGYYPLKLMHSEDVDNYSTLPLENAQNVFMTYGMSEAMMSKVLPKETIRSVLLQELTYELEAFVDKIIEVNEERLRKK